ncbi:Photosystem I reaction center subunit V [Cardamine amara subsp. amara]|uniref:Photosystem I reaction center subunit V n=1 Tax=Cardamine amara subsp. amara TaxID=228776 RepID=A0ABD1ADL1_CARAN
MATSSSALISPTTFSAAVPQRNLNSISFHGLRPLRLGGNSSGLPNLSLVSSGKRSSSTVVKSALNPSVVISLSTGLSLFLGRFVFFNFQRENVAKQGLPEQNGKTHFEAGDDRAKEYMSDEFTEIERSRWIQHCGCARLGINRTYRCLLHLSHFQ